MHAYLVIASELAKVAAETVSSSTPPTPGQLEIAKKLAERSKFFLDAVIKM